MPRITHVIDASALIAYSKGEAGHERFVELLADEENILAIHIVNPGEVYYNYYRSERGLAAGRLHKVSHWVMPSRLQPRRTTVSCS